MNYTQSMNPTGLGIAIGNNFCAISFSRNYNGEIEKLSSDLMVSGCSDYSMKITKLSLGDAKP